MALVKKSYQLKPHSIHFLDIGNITLGDIMEILPFEDSIVALELDGQTIWEAFEAGLTTWPAQEGCAPLDSYLFPILTIYFESGASLSYRDSE